MSPSRTPPRTPPERAAHRRLPRSTASADQAPGTPELFRQALLLAVLVTAAAVAMPLRAQAPEHERPLGAPQAVGAVHTVRTIPEACTRLEGVFTGEAAQPYRMQVVATGGHCQPRARYVEPAQAAPSQGTGWILGDVVRIPDAACRSRQAVVKVWRKPVEQPLERDGQGQVRIYLEDARKQAAAGRTRPLPEYSAQLELEPGRCR